MMPWELVCLFVFSCSFVWVLVEYRSMRDPISLFLFFAIWFRILLPFLHEYTMRPIALGMSGAALSTLSIIGVGFILISIHRYFKTYLVSFYAIFAIIALSGIINGQYQGLVNDLSRWLFFLVVALLTVRAMELHGVTKILRIYLVILAPALVVQMLGVAGGVRWVGPDGAVSYIGGHFSESAFWKVLFALICVASLLRTKRDLVPLGIALVCMFGIYLTAHRTALMGALPVLGLLAVSVLGHIKVPVFKVLLVMGACIVIVPLVSLVPSITPERYQAIFEFGANLDLAFANPAELTEEELRLGTGRIGIWSELLYRWRSGTEVHHLLGFGPDTAFIPPHNEFVGFLYQSGVLGLFAFLLMLLWQTILMTQVPDRPLAFRLLGCMAGFLLTCFTSNQVWAIEGLLILAVICATTWAALEQKYRRSAGSPTTEPDQDRRATSKIGGRWTKPASGAQTRPAV